MALKGDTSNLLLADIFQTLFQNGQSGVLHLRSGEIERRVLFSSHGVTLLDATAFQAARLGHLFIASGLIEAKTVDSAIAEIEKHGEDPFSSIKLLVVLDEDSHLELSRGVAVLRLEVREELFEVFGFDRMEFEFVEESMPIEGIPRECYFRPEEVVMEAARRVDEWSRIRETVGSGDRYYVVSSDATFPGAEEILALLDGTNTPIDISERLLVSRFEVSRIVWQLLESNKLRPATTDELLRFATSETHVSRHKTEQLLRRAVSMLDESDARLDEAAEAAIRVNARELAVDILVCRARALHAEGHPEAAYTEARRARELMPDRRQVIELLADIHRSRGERDAEVKLLTVLAEMSAQEKRFDAAVEIASRVAQLAPDSPLLDHAFVIYCQNSNRAAFGAEVLSRAASLRENKARVALLYRGILTLDPLRSDVRKQLAQLDSKQHKGRIIVVSIAFLMLPVVGLFARYVYDRFKHERLRGQAEAIERMVGAGEFKAAQAALSSLGGEELEDDMRATVDRLAAVTHDKLEELDEQKRSQNVNDARTELGAIQTELEAKHYAKALSLLTTLGKKGASNANGAAEAASPRENLLATKRKVLLHAIEQRASDLETKAHRFEIPHEDADLKRVLDEFSPDFSSEVESDFASLKTLIHDLDDDGAWKDLKAPLATAADRGAAAVASVYPGLAEIRERLARNVELNLLSDDYQQILAAEKAGDYTTAEAGYARLLREYGNGNLASYFTKRHAAAEKIASEMTQIRALCDKGEAEDALRRMKTLIKETPDAGLAETIGLPQRIETTPVGADVRVANESLGHTPCCVWIKSSKENRFTLRSAGFRDMEITLTADSPARNSIDLPREARFTVPLEAKVEVAAVTTSRHVFVGARDGVLYRLNRNDGTRAGEVHSKSLSGVCAPPMVFGKNVLVPFGEGAVSSIDSETLHENWTSPLDSRIVGLPIQDGNRMLCATEKGGIFAVDPTNGDVRSVAAIDVPLRSGPVVIGNSLAVGSTTGEVIAIDLRDGQSVFRTPKKAQPITGLAAAGSRFVAADDAGVLTTFDSASGDAGWHLDTGAAAAAPPTVSDGLLVFASGKKAIVLDATSGAQRFAAEAKDWISGTPTIAGGRLYIVDRSGALDVFDVNSKLRLFRHTLGAPALAQPLVLPEGVLVVTSSGEVSIVGS